MLGTESIFLVPPDQWGVRSPLTAPLLVWGAPSCPSPGQWGVRSPLTAPLLVWGAPAWPSPGQWGVRSPLRAPLLTSTSGQAGSSSHRNPGHPATGNRHKKPPSFLEDTCHHVILTGGHCDSSKPRHSNDTIPVTVWHHIWEWETVQLLNLCLWGFSH